MTATTETVEQIPLEQLHAGDNIRRRLGDIAQLAASIGSTGIHEPLIVRPLAGPSACGHGTEHWQVVAGHRRLSAAVRAGLATAPCIVRDLTDDDVDDVMLIENLQREDLAPLDEATGLLRLVTRGMTIKDLAERIGRTQKHVSGRLDLLNLHSAIADLLDAGKIGIAQARKAGEAHDSDDGQLLVEHLDDQALAELLAEAADDHNPAWSIEQAAKPIREQQLRDQIQSACDAGGPPLVVKTEADQWGREKYSKGLRRVDDDYSGRGLGIGSKHDDEPCHALAVESTYEGVQVVGMCTDWRRHKPGAAGIVSPVLKRKADDRASSKEANVKARQRRNDHDARLTHLIDAADPRELITAALQHGAREEVSRQNAQTTDRVADILGIEYGEDLHAPPEGSYSNRSHSERALVAHLEASQAGAVRVLTLLALLHWRCPLELTDLLDDYAPALDEEGA